jgi:type I site-specific restriction endonuclease
MARSKDTEVDAYIFIKENLKQLGWNTKNPARNPAGEVFTQNECHYHPQIKKVLGNLTPENIVKLSEKYFWIIEAKRTHMELDKALSEAENYAKSMNKSKTIKALIITGLAGNQTDRYLMKSRYLKGKSFVPITINGKEISSLVSKHIAGILLNTKNPSIKGCTGR